MGCIKILITGNSSITFLRQGIFILKNHLVMLVRFTVTFSWRGKIVGFLAQFFTPSSLQITLHPVL